MENGLMLEMQMLGPVIQLALAPIFMLVAISALLGVVTQRLGRVVDRARQLEDLIDTDDGDHARHYEELQVIAARMRFANRATILCTIGALFTCSVVVVLFVGGVTGADAGIAISVLFVLTMLCLVAGLSQFLAEVFVAVRMLHVRSDLLINRASEQDQIE